MQQEQAGAGKLEVASFQLTSVSAALQGLSTALLVISHHQCVRQDLAQQER